MYPQVESTIDANGDLVKSSSPGDLVKSSSPLRRLRWSIQKYDWGRIGSESFVAKLHAANSCSQIDPDRPYAELWMGTHESGPSYVVTKREESGCGGDGGGSPFDGSGDVTLKSWISKNSNVLGDRVSDKWGCDLPFLFKVLSVAKALSIQAHPDKQLAEKLHKSFPDLYKDDNHKPEMALAITNFEALCGFVTLKELKDVLHSVHEIVELVGDEVVNQVYCVNEQDGKEEEVKDVLRSIFTELMSACPDKTKEVVQKMKNRLQTESKERELTDKEQLVLQLEKQYPGDIGVISAFFFNHVKLNPGEAVCLGADEPHAYLSGECIECMATSDNVVRAGLTSKHRDVETLCSMLTYKQGVPEILKGFVVKPYITRYLPAFDEFEVDHCDLPGGESAVFPAVSGPSIFLVTEGQGKMVTGSNYNDVVGTGDVMFAPANIEVRVTAASDLKLYRAGVNSRFFQ